MKMKIRRDTMWGLDGLWLATCLSVDSEDNIKKIKVGLPHFTSARRHHRSLSTWIKDGIHSDCSAVVSFSALRQNKIQVVNLRKQLCANLCGAIPTNKTSS